MLNRELSDQEKQQLPCYQNPGPWQDDNTAAAQKWAARQCVTRCTQRDWCDQERQAALSECGIATGVWSGRIWTHRECHVDKGAHPVG